MKIAFIKLLQNSSENFTCGTYPDDWYDMDEIAQAEWFDENTWELMEGVDKNVLTNIIEAAARSFASVLTSLGVEVTNIP